MRGSGIGDASKSDEARNPQTGQFKPGHSGNPDGRPKSRYLSGLLRDRIEEVDPTDTDGRTHGQIIADNWVSAAKAGKYSPAVAASLADRVEGKPRQTVKLVPREAQRRLDLSKLTDEELRQHLALLEKCGIESEGEADG